MTILREIFLKSELVIPMVLLYVVAWTRFNSPPTNRSSTTFALFFIGVTFYYALILALWLLVTIGIVQGSIGLDWIGSKLAMMSPEARAELAQHAPIFAALIIVVAAQFRQVSLIDKEARAFCIKLAAIPREADRLSIELSQGTDLEPNARLRNQVAKIISSISPEALNFSRDGTLSARFTRAVALYCLFVGPRKSGTALEFAASAHSKSAYAEIMKDNEPSAAHADSHYEELIHTGLAYFRSPQPAKELYEALDLNITALSNLTCGLIARYVLYCDRTRNGRLRRLLGMGFDAHPTPRFGLDHWAATILLVTLLSILMMFFTPGTKPIEVSGVLTIAVTFGVSMGFAVLGAIVVAQRFILRHGDKRPAFPPIAELMLAALIAASLSAGLRIGISLVPALTQGGELQGVFDQFIKRLPGVINPFVCTISLGLLCSYLGSLNWSWYRVAAVGALGNGLALMAAGWMVGSLVDFTVLAQFYLHPERAVQTIALTTGLTGVVVGAMVLAVFNKSERVRKDAVECAAKGLQATVVQNLDIPPLPSASRSEADRDLGGYKRADVQSLEGRYVCFRPAFSRAEVINAYLMFVNWDKAESCLKFEERDRVDVGHTQTGHIYIPDDQPFMSLVTVEKGAMRLIMVSRPKGKESACGLILTLSNPGAAHFTPACSPIVLRRLVDETPQLGFIHPGTPGYEEYRKELELVMTASAVFATASQTASMTPKLPTIPSEDVGLLPAMNGAVSYDETASEHLGRSSRAHRQKA